MSFDAQQLIHGYLDDSLTAEQHEQLSQWIKSNPDHARAFAAQVMLHDRLRNEWTISGTERRKGATSGQNIDRSMETLS